MKKRSSPVFLVIGIIFSILAGFVMIKMFRFRLLTPAASTVPQEQSISSFNPITTPFGEVTAQKGADMPQVEGEQWMTFDGIKLLEDQVGFTFSMRCPVGKTVDILPIDIIAWHQGVFENGEFGIGKPLAVAWEHQGYEGLWIHSGWDFLLERSPATDLQYFLETNDLNEVQPLKTQQAKMNECLLGGSVEIYSEGIARQGKVTAVARVPSGQVEELSKHTMDLVPYLGGAYPESGFAELDPNSLLIYFCGRAALDEITDPNADYWTQARFILAITPGD